MSFNEIYIHEIRNIFKELGMKHTDNFKDCAIYSLTTQYFDNFRFYRTGAKLDITVDR
jgi:hypothetical protein